MITKGAMVSALLAQSTESVAVSTQSDQYTDSSLHHISHNMAQTATQDLDSGLIRVPVKKFNMLAQSQSLPASIADKQVTL